MKLLQRLASTIDELNERIGKGISWFTTFLVVIICYDILVRSLNSFFRGDFFTGIFGGSIAIPHPAISIFELEWHFFAIIFLLGAGYALKHDSHVRVDVFYHNFPTKTKAWINLIGTLVFLLPFCYILITASGKFVSNSFAIGESSADPGGLPARYLIKGAIFFGAFLLMLQALSLMARSILTIGNSSLTTD